MERDMAEWILVRPTKEDEQDALRYVAEYGAAGPLPIMGGASLGEMPYDEWLRQIANYETGKNLPEGPVPASFFFLKKAGEERIYGTISVRHRLTEVLLSRAGNIGYSIRPCERRKGLGSIQLGLAIEICREMGMDKVLVTCLKENRASALTILSQGGVEDLSYTQDNGAVYRRFWIPTGERIGLRKPRHSDRAAAEEMIAEFHANGETMLYGSGGAGDSPYDEWLEKMRRYATPATVPEGNVPQDVRFGVKLPSGQLIGYIALRPMLSDALFHIGGNTGYCIRPSERRKGYGHAQLGRALAWLSEHGVKQALLTCADTNKASAATILSQGGVEDDVYIDEIGIPHRRFWIPTGERLILRRPDPSYEKAVAEMTAEFAEHGEEFIYGSSGVNRLPYDKWLEKLNRATEKELLPPDRMPQHTYLGVLVPENRPVGFIAIRPELNEALRNSAGNIGYSIRPSERQKGYGKAQLMAALRKIGEKGVEQALVTCDEDNEASAATILACGGLEDKPYIEENGAKQRRFWIEIERP